MRNTDFSAGRTWLGAKSSMASVMRRTMASVGWRSRASNCGLRGVNHSRSLCRARLRRNLSASGVKYGWAAAGSGLSLVGMTRKSVLCRPIEGAERGAGGNRRHERFPIEDVFLSPGLRSGTQAWRCDGSGTHIRRSGRLIALCGPISGRPPQRYAPMNTAVEASLARAPEMGPQDTAAAGRRIVSIDIFRGITMAVMIFVNELSGVGGMPWWTRHAPGRLDYMTYVDMVFPFFLFAVG